MKKIEPKPEVVDATTNRQVEKVIEQVDMKEPLPLLKTSQSVGQLPPKPDLFKKVEARKEKQLAPLNTKVLQKLFPKPLIPVKDKESSLSQKSKED